MCNRNVPRYSTFCWTSRRCGSDAAGRNIASACAHVTERRIVLFRCFVLKVYPAHLVHQLHQICFATLTLYFPWKMHGRVCWLFIGVQALVGLGAIVTPVSAFCARHSSQGKHTTTTAHLTADPTPHKSVVKSPPSRSRMQNLPARVFSMSITG
jgi:hypothetical protein